MLDCKTGNQRHVYTQQWGILIPLAPYGEQGRISLLRPTLSAGHWGRVIEQQRPGRLYFAPLYTVYGHLLLS